VTSIFIIIPVSYINFFNKGLAFQGTSPNLHDSKNFSYPYLTKNKQIRAFFFAFFFSIEKLNINTLYLVNNTNLFGRRFYSINNNIHVKPVVSYSNAETQKKLIQLKIERAQDTSEGRPKFKAIKSQMNRNRKDFSTFSISMVKYVNKFSLVKYENKFSLVKYESINFSKVIRFPIPHQKCIGVEPTSNNLLLKFLNKIKAYIYSIFYLFHKNFNN
jgi:hypothetical protein